MRKHTVAKVAGFALVILSIIIAISYKNSSPPSSGKIEQISQTKVTIDDLIHYLPLRIAKYKFTAPKNIRNMTIKSRGEGIEEKLLRQVDISEIYDKEFTLTIVVTYNDSLIKSQKIDVKYEISGDKRSMNDVVTLNPNPLSGVTGCSLFKVIDTNEKCQINVIESMNEEYTLTFEFN